MNLIIGGAYQGKLDYAKEKYGFTDKDVFTCSFGPELDLSRPCIYKFEQYLKYCSSCGIQAILDFPEDTVVIMDDIFCGVVPVDSDIRAWREFAGRAGAALTRKSKTVTRLFCGIPQVLKTSTKKIYMIRHGKTQANIDYFYCGKSDLHLTEIGKKELEDNKAVINYPNPDGLDFYTSTLSRTKETLEVLYPGAKSTEMRAFDEMDFGDFEERKYDGDLQYDQDFVIWTSGNNDTNVCPHGESSMMMKRRVLRAFEEFIDKPGDSLIVTHGGPIAAVFLKYIPDSGLNYYDIQPKNGEGYCFEFDGKKFVGYNKITKRD